MKKAKKKFKKVSKKEMKKVKGGMTEYQVDYSSKYRTK
jgi:bacteriocin-like protein